MPVVWSKSVDSIYILLHSNMYVKQGEYSREMRAY